MASGDRVRATHDGLRDIDADVETVGEQEGHDDDAFAGVVEGADEVGYSRFLDVHVGREHSHAGRPAHCVRRRD